MIDVTTLALAKAYINKVIAEVSGGGLTEAEIKEIVATSLSEIVAGADTDYDTLKEISDWIISHKESAASMNSSIQQNTKDAAAAKSVASEAKNASDTANTTASTAKSTADTAKTTADTAKSTADTAKSTANTAKSTADSAAKSAKENATKINNILEALKTVVTSDTAGYSIGVENGLFFIDDGKE